LNTLVLKLLAVVFMIADHIGAVFFPNAAIFRLVGRLSYPLFAFCIAQGLIHTKSKAKYSLRLLIFAVASQAPYFLAFDKKPFDKLNVLFTFSLICAAVALYEYIPSLFEKKKYNIAVELESDKFKDKAENISSGGVLKYPLMAFSLTLPIPLAYFLNAEYAILTFLIVYSIYFIENKYTAISMAALSCPASYVIQGLLSNGKLPTKYTMIFSAVCAFSILLTVFYNGKKGKGLKYFFYVFYPAHLLLLYILRLVIR